MNLQQIHEELEQIDTERKQLKERGKQLMAMRHKLLMAENEEARKDAAQLVQDGLAARRERQRVRALAVDASVMAR